MSDSIYTTGGTVQAAGGLYIERTADVELLTLCKAGAFVYVLNARQMGKSSLVAHVAEQLATSIGIRPVIIDLTQIGTQVSAEGWYLGLLDKIAEQLDLNTNAVAWWRTNSHLSLAQRLTDFLREVVLSEVAEPVTIFVDEIDTTLNLDFTDDFYAAIRALYNARAQEPQLARLSFVLIGVALPGDLIKDPQRTPFNIGRQVSLFDFTSEEVQPFAQGLGLAEAQATQVLARVMYWTHGHPYLTQRLCLAIAEQQRSSWTKAAVDALVADLFLGERSKQDNNLHFVRDMLTRRAIGTIDPVGILETYRAVRRGWRVPDDDQSLVKAHLRLSGVVRREGNLLRVRNRVYAAAFDDGWIRTHLPADYWSQRVRRYTLAAIAGLIVLSVLLGTFLIGSNSRVAELESALNTARTAEARAVASERNAVAARQTAEASQLQENAARADAEQRRVSALTAESQKLAIAGNSLLARDPETALLLGYEALARNRNPLSEQLLRNALLQPLWRPTIVLTHTSALVHVAFSPDGLLIATGTDDGQVYLWSNDGEAKGSWKAHTAAVTRVAFSPDGNQLATSSDDGTATLWDLSGQLVTNFDGPHKHTNHINSIAFSPDGSHLVTASFDGTAKTWTRAGDFVKTISDRGYKLRNAEYSPDGSSILTSSTVGTVVVWDIKDGNYIPEEIQNQVNTLIWNAHFSPDGKYIIAVTDNKSARLTTLSDRRQNKTLGGHDSVVSDAAFINDHQTIVTSSWDGNIRFWSTKGRFLSSFRGHTGHVEAVVISPDGRTLVTASADKTAKIWIPAQQSQVVLHKHTDQVNLLRFSPTGDHFLSASEDGTIILWSNEGKYEQTLTTKNNSNIIDAGFSPNGSVVTATLADGSVHVWQVKGAFLRELRQSTVALTKLAFSPDGQSIVTGSKDGVARLWAIGEIHYRTENVC